MSNKSRKFLGIIKIYKTIGGRFYDVVVYGVDKGESDGEDVNGTPYKVIAITPDLLRDGYVVTEYGKCKFNGMSFMPINFDGKKLPRQ